MARWFVLLLLCHAVPALAGGPASKEEKAEARKLNNAGFEAHKAKKFAEAAKLFKKATEFDRDYAKAHFNLACALTQQFKKDPCGTPMDPIFEALRRAVDLDPKRGKKLFTDNDLRPLWGHPEIYLIAGKALDGHAALNMLLWRQSMNAGILAAGNQIGAMDDESWWYKSFHTAPDGKVVKKFFAGNYRVKNNKLELCRKSDKGCKQPLLIRVDKGNLIVRGVSGDRLDPKKESWFPFREECSS